MSEKKFICYLKFEKGGTFYFKDDPSWSDVYVHGGLRWARSTIKSPIFVQLPVEEEVEGAYGYDLGFINDRYVLEYFTSEWSEYIKLVELIKSNGAEHIGVLTIGYEGETIDYNVICNNIDASGEQGRDLIQINITLSIVTKKYVNSPTTLIPQTPNISSDGKSNNNSNFRPDPDFKIGVR